MTAKRRQRGTLLLAAGFAALAVLLGAAIQAPTEAAEEDATWSREAAVDADWLWSGSAGPDSHYLWAEGRDPLDVALIGSSPSTEYSWAERSATAD